ncbi:hypothetical protein AB1Y20_018114 [Prymnesium parvum]|uniref:SGNH hydrolase-type esterase domain-containing protein n=1 Tax=Prymnesium parvum TaxID=97485 RepID=A0AB34JNE0_PRYPA
MLFSHASASSSAAASSPSSSSAVRLMALGDSITDGGTKHRSYRYHLHRLLQKAGLQVEWVGSMRGVFDLLKGRNASRGKPVRWQPDWPLDAQRHEGHWGWTSKQILWGHERQPQRGFLSKWLRWAALRQQLPQLTLVHLGTNDLTKHVAREGESVASLARRLRAVAQQLCRVSPRMRIFVASPIPYCRFNKGDAREQRARRQKLEAELARRLHAMAARPIAECRPRQVLYVNMSEVVTCEHLIHVDGVHPSAYAAMQMARQWLRAIEPHVRRAHTAWHPIKASPIQISEHHANGT